MVQFIIIVIIIIIGLSSGNKLTSQEGKTRIAEHTDGTTLINKIALWSKAVHSEM